MSGFVYSLCDLTGNMVRPWAEAGYECICFDMQHSIRQTRVEIIGSGSITYQWANVRSLTAADIRDPKIIFAFPPCTNLTVSGSRDWKLKGLRGFIDGLEVVESCRQLCEWPGVPWMLENPVGRLSQSWRDPDHSFDPCDYGDPYTKKTLIWAGNGFTMPPRVKQGAPGLFGEHERVEATEGSKMWLIPPSADQANLRSETPMGFARAVFEANSTRANARGAA